MKTKSSNRIYVFCILVTLLHRVVYGHQMKDFEYFTTTLGLSTNSAFNIQLTPFFGGGKIRHCGEFVVRKDVNAPESGILHVYDKDGTHLLIGSIIETKDFESAREQAFKSLTFTSNSSIEGQVCKFATLNDIGDFCITDRQRIGKMLLFVRGTKVVYLTSRINDGFDMMSIAKAIDEAILADAKECQQTHGKDSSR